MCQAVREYCEDNDLTVFELFLKAYADFTRQPVAITGIVTVRQDANAYRMSTHDCVPHYVKMFLERARPRQLILI